MKFLTLIGLALLLWLIIGPVVAHFRAGKPAPAPLKNRRAAVPGAEDADAAERARRHEPAGAAFELHEAPDSVEYAVGARRRAH